MTLGLKPILVLAPSFFLGILTSLSEFTADESAGVEPRGEGIAEVLESASSSSSAPKDSFPFAAILRFFLKEGCGVDVLCFAN
jgi:hypothetical protein